MFKRILLCFDGSDGARQAAEVALKLAVEQGAHVEVLSVIEHLPRYSATMGEVDDEYEYATAYFRDGQQPILERAAQLGVMTASKVVVGNPPQSIVQVAEEGGFDLAVMGHSGHSEIWGRFMGTTADKVARHAHCSVLIVR